MPGTDSRIDLLVAEVQVLQLRVVELQERVSALEIRGGRRSTCRVGFACFGFSPQWFS